MGGISIWQLVIIAVIVILLFGTKKLRNLGGDLGSAIKGFKNAISDEKEKDSAAESESSPDSLADTSASQSKTSEKDAKKDNSQA